MATSALITKTPSRLSPACLWAIRRPQAPDNCAISRSEPRTWQFEIALIREIRSKQSLYFGRRGLPRERTKSGVADFVNSPLMACGRTSLNAPAVPTLYFEDLR